MKQDTHSNWHYNNNLFSVQMVIVFFYLYCQNANGINPCFHIWSEAVN